MPKPETDTQRIIREMVERDPTMAETIEAARVELAAYRAAHGGRWPITVKKFDLPPEA
jgi:hypothetical protein